MGRSRFASPQWGAGALLPFPGRSAVRSESEVPHCRPGIVARSEFAKTPDQRCGMSRRTASGERKSPLRGVDDSHRVFSKISRPMSMRRISEVPAPIS